MILSDSRRPEIWEGGQAKNNDSPARQGTPVGGNGLELAESSLWGMKSVTGLLKDVCVLITRVRMLSEEGRK